jgi:hypothetical protein
MMNYSRDLDALRRRANANLVGLAGGSARRERERVAARRQAAAEARAIEREARKADRALLRALRAEYKELRKLCDDYDARHTAGELERDEMGAYEEIDHRCDQLSDEIARLERDL